MKRRRRRSRRASPSSWDRRRQRCFRRRRRRPRWTARRACRPLCSSRPRRVRRLPRRTTRQRIQRRQMTRSRWTRTTGCASAASTRARCAWAAPTRRTSRWATTARVRSTRARTRAPSWPRSGLRSRRSWPTLTSSCCKRCPAPSGSWIRRLRPLRACWTLRPRTGASGRRSTRKSRARTARWSARAPRSTSALLRVPYSSRGGTRCARWAQPSLTTRRCRCCCTTRASPTRPTATS